MMDRNSIAFGLLFLLGNCAHGRADSAVVEVIADPVVIQLHGPNAGYSLLVHGKTADGQLVDLTHAARYSSVDPSIAKITSFGFVRGVADGSGSISVEVAGRKLTVPVVVTDSTRPRQLHFENDILPLLSKFGCNSSGCHGKAEGQNGFKLSVFGFDKDADYAALTKESRGRRVFSAAPEHSLLMRKISGTLAHGGGVRIRRGTDEYATLRSWIAAGMPVGDAADPKVTGIRVEPSERVLAMHGRQQLRVIARYSSGREADVTAHAKFQSNNEGLASVNENGLVLAGDVPGDVAIMAGYMNQVDVFRGLVPRAEPIAESRLPAANSFIDTLVFKKLRQLHLTPSAPADDAEYLRRVYLDVIGTLPTAAEARRFLADRRPSRRALLVDELLERTEFAEFWALKWADVLRVDRQALGHKGAYAYYRWIRESMAANKPLDQFAREIITASGPLKDVAPAHFYKVAGKPGELASTLSQVFLGVRIACAECHHHPFDRWSQNDYYGMQAFFTPVRFTGSPRGEMLTMSGPAETKHPRSGQTIFPHALDTTATKLAPVGDPRELLASWMTAKDNPWFARNLANRTWAHFLGRGLVEPVDDVRATNPPSNPELLDALARVLVENRYDFRKLVRIITASRVYQVSSRPNVSNLCDEQNYSRALFKRIEAEVMLDMVCQTTGIGEKFPGVPSGFRAIQLWDSKVPHYFLKLFGRPERVSACECERNAEPSVSQVLHMLNSRELHAKLCHEGGTVARLSWLINSDAALAEELYLTFHNRFPTVQERDLAVTYLAKNSNKRREAAEDLAWSMLNSLEFVFNH